VNRSHALLALVCLMTSGQSSPAMEVSEFLKEHDLQAYHATCVKFFSALVEARPEAATKVLADSAGVPTEKLPDGMKRLALQAAARCNEGVIDIELVGFSMISSRAIALYFIAHTKREPLLFVLMPYRRKDTWNTYFWAFEPEAAKILEWLKGLPRFSGDTVLPLTKGDKAA
jgi:hypothetical protein